MKHVNYLASMKTTHIITPK